MPENNNIQAGDTPSHHQKRGFRTHGFSYTIWGGSLFIDILTKDQPCCQQTHCQSNQCTAECQQNFLIQPLSTLLYLINFIQSLSLGKSYDFFLGLHIIFFFHLFYLQGKTHRDTKQDNSGCHPINIKPQDKGYCGNDRNH